MSTSRTEKRGTLLIGVATRDITPPIGAVLVGYWSRTSTSVGHPLRAEAMVVRQGENGWALVTADLCALSRPFVQRIRAAIGARVPLPPEAILIAADHTHSGPAANKADWFPGHPDQPYFDTLAATLVEAVCDAWNTASPGDFEVTETQAPALASNRRVQDAEGRWTNAWDDPTGTHTGFFDPTVTLTAVRRPGGRLDALLVTYGCHPVVLGYQSLAISADYCGYMKDALEEAGDLGTVLFGVAGHGNIDPRVCVQSEASVAESMGRALAAIVREALPSLRPLAPGTPRFHAEPWSIVRSRTLTDTPDQQFHRLNLAGQVFETEVLALGVGELALVGLPGEAVSEIVAAVRRASPLAHTRVLSAANDFIGYIPTDEIQRQGAHEATYAPAEEIEAPVLAKAQAALEALRR